MKTRRILLVVFVLAALAAIIFYVERLWERDEKVVLWDMVPESAVMVYENSQFPATWEHLSTNEAWQNMQGLEGFQQLEQNISLLDSLADFRQFFTDRQLLIGLHVIAKDEFDFSYYFALQNSAEQLALRQALHRFEKQPHIKKENRQFNGQTIYELTDTRNGKQFSYVLYYNIFAGSFTPFLVEDVVRNINGGFQEFSFGHHNTSVANVPRLNDDEGNLYINAAKLPLFLSAFVKSEANASLQPLSHLCETIFLDVNLDEQLLLNGFSTSEEGAPVENQQGPSSLLATFRGQQPATLDIFSYVPQRTAMLLHYAATGGREWIEQLHRIQEQQGRGATSASLKARQQLKEYLGTEVADLTDWLKGEVALMLLESVDTTEPDKLLVMQATDTAAALESLQTLEARLSREPETITYREQFAGYEISEISFPEFPAALLGPSALGFKETFYYVSDDYVIFANSIRALKRLMADKDAENTWDKSIQQMRFLESSLDKANLSLFINTSRSWRLLTAKLSPEWKQLAEKHETALKSFEHLALQFSRNEEDFYTSLAVDYRQLEQGETDQQLFSSDSRLFVKESLSTRPFVVRDHQDQTLEILFQDAANHLYLSETNGEQLWRDSLQGQIISEVYQIDFFKNKKLQYLFATDSALHIIDRTGAYVEGYPLYMPQGVSIRHLSLVDYDKSLNYRFLVTDQEGRMWMFNKARENLPGWNPNQVVSGPHATAPFHVRVREKDYLVALQQDGTILALNRRGNAYEGFPIALNTPISSPVFTELGSSAGNTSLTTVTAMGELISFNLLGSLLKREQIYRPNPETQFRLSLDVLGKTYLIARQDEQMLGILDREGRLLFEKNYISPAALAAGKLEVQYYDFGAGNEIIAVTDQVQEFTYLFRPDGMLIKDRPIESRFPVAILYFDAEQRFELFRNFENEFSVVSFRL